jgi:heme O synthase-like polyprenyltransferase
MEIATIPVPRLKFSSQSRVAARLPDFITLMKPRVMVLAVFTAVVGLMIAPGRLDPLLGATAILAIAAGAGAAGVLNMWYDADIDALMTRTAMRPIPLHRSKGTDRRAAQRLFAFSILYLFVLFAAFLLSNLGNRWSSTLPPHAEPSFTSSSQGERPVGLIDNARNSISS